MNLRDKVVMSNHALSVISKTKIVQTHIQRLPTSVKKDESGISQKDKRELIKKIDSIYKELLVLKNKIEEESWKMKIRFSDMSNMIAEEVMSSIEPTIRKVVREEIARGVKKIVQENKALREEIMQKNLFDQEGDFIGEQSSITNETRELIAKRSRDKAKNIIEKQLGNDPYADLIMSAVDPNEEKQKIEEQKLSQPMVKSSEVQKGDMVDPLNMDFSDRMDRLV